ncbi:RPAP1-like protein [Coniochaeta hoffmannii]|uniref:RPAP1-like protein n=1 Tax=Coniochaeta hoffmannii TaxID=91930 RepID=A0AA38VR32_9PEZI|nr:RPAP1-like protein [Coniochaeta hoffmannii]
MDLILDVKEKDISDVKAPSLPTLTAGRTGFPEHKKRSRPSAFKQKRQAAAAQENVETKAQSTSLQSTAPSGSDGPADERRKIDLENTARLESMSQDEIAQAQQELLNELDPSLVQMLLRRANLDDVRDKKDPFAVQAAPPDASETAMPQHQEPPAISVEDTSAATAATEDNPPKVEPTHTQPKRAKKKVTFDEDATTPAPPADLFVSDDQSHPQPHSHDTTHFPAAPSAPDLDPSDPDFLANLHSKYFPNLPADPAKLAWMAPIPTPNSPADLDSPYHPSQSALPVSALRFDFRGRLVPPRLARRIPSTAGLHHHAEAPEAAGYTVPELARLARSAVPAQRCIAYQTLGRLLFRLGRGEWGVGEGGRDGEEDDLAFSIWRLVKAGYVIESLEEAAGVEEGVGHRGARAYAIEALWLFEKGGWKEKWRGL